MKRALIVSVIFGLSAPAVANETTPLSVINPACADAPFRDFDFWLGTWDVTTSNGQIAGVNRLTSEEGGCRMVERWRGAGGGTGQSYNYVDRDTGQWRQIWVSSSFTIDYSGGLDEGGVYATRWSDRLRR